MRNASKPYDQILSSVRLYPGFIPVVITGQWLPVEQTVTKEQIVGEVAGVVPGHERGRKRAGRDGERVFMA
jgi:hypothetical protein